MTFNFTLKKKKIEFICFPDSYRVHFCDECMDFARALNIHIIKILEGTTGLYQPMDKKIFGILKSKVRSFINKSICDELMKNFDQQKGVFREPLPPPKTITKKET